MVNQQTATTQVSRSGWTLEDKSDLLLKLYQKAMLCMDDALDLIERGEMVEKGKRLIQAQEIVMQLSDALDYQGEGYEVAENLNRLYIYVYRLLIRGNTRLDCEAIGEARVLMARLLTAWEQVAQGPEPALPSSRARF
jgi:flagellar protein FliS